MRNLPDAIIYVLHHDERAPRWVRHIFCNGHAGIADARYRDGDQRTPTRTSCKTYPTVLAASIRQRMLASFEGCVGCRRLDLAGP